MTVAPLSLWFSVVQSVAAAFSLVLLLVYRTTQSSIKLPITTGESLDDVLRSDVTHVDLDALYSMEHEDPFDVSTPLDFMDGFPIDEDAFWSMVSKYMAHFRLFLLKGL